MGLKDTSSLQKHITLVMEEKNFIYLNSHNKLTENPKLQFKPLTTIIQSKPLLPAFNYNPKTNQYMYPIFHLNIDNQFVTLDPPLPTFNFTKLTSYPSFRSTQNMPPFNFNRSFLNQNTNFR